MYFSTTFLLLFLFYNLNLISSNKNCTEINDFAKKYCRRFATNLQETCLKKRLKRSGCFNSCENDCVEDVHVYDKESSKITTTLDIANLINNNNKINQTTSVNSFINNDILIVPQKRAICCKILIPKCEKFHPKRCNLSIEKRCGKICEDNIRYNNYLGYYYNYFIRSCVAQSLYDNNCYDYNYQYCYYSYYQRVKWCEELYNWYYNYGIFNKKRNEGVEETFSNSLDVEENVITTTEISSKEVE